MKQTTCALLLALVGGLFCQSSALADDKIGKLTYDQQRGANPGKMLSGRFRKPGKNMKGLVSKNAVVARFSKFLIALDGDAKDTAVAHLDKIKIDFTRKGDFTNASVIKSQFKKMYGGYRLEKKGNTQGVVHGHKANISYHFRFTPRNLKSIVGNTCNVAIGIAAVGKCQIGDKVYNVRVLDLSGDLALNSKIKQPIAARYQLTRIDKILVQTSKTGWTSCFSGKAVKINNKWWVVSVDDQMNISAKPFTGKLAKLNLACKFWSAWLASDSCIIKISMHSGPIELPAGKYNVIEYRALQSDDVKTRGPRIEAYNSWHAKNQLIIKPGITNTPKIGSEIIAKPNVKRLKGGKLKISVKLHDELGTATLKAYRQGRRRYKAPTIEIYDESGKKLLSKGLKYG